MHEYDSVLKVLLQNSANSILERITCFPVARWFNVELPEMQETCSIAERTASRKYYSNSRAGQYSGRRVSVSRSLALLQAYPSVPDFDTRLPHPCLSAPYTARRRSNRYRRQRPPRPNRLCSKAGSY